MYEADQLAAWLAGLRRRFADAFDFEATLDEQGGGVTLTFPSCALRKVVSAHGEVVGSANLCEVFHEYFAGLMSAFSGRNYAVATVGTVGQCTMRFQIRS